MAQNAEVLLAAMAAQRPGLEATWDRQRNAAVGALGRAPVERKKAAVSAVLTDTTLWWCMKGKTCPRT